MDILNRAGRVLLWLSVSGTGVAAAAALVWICCKRWAPKWFLYVLWLPALAGFWLPLGCRYSLTNSLRPEAASSGAQAPVVLIQEAVPFSRIDETPVSIPEGPEQAVPVYWGGLWLLGAGLVFLVRLTGYFAFCFQVQKADQMIHPWEQMLLEELAGSKAPKLLRSRAVRGPMLLWWGGSVLVLPVQTFAPDVLRDILEHELCHKQRYDLVWKWLAALTVCLHWPNPAVWLLEQRIAQDCELSCDEVVLRSKDRDGRLHYGRTLVLVAAGTIGQSRNMDLVLPMQTAKHRLKERIELTMTRSKKTRRTGCALCAAALSLGLSTIVLGAYSGEGQLSPVPAPASVEAVPELLPDYIPPEPAEEPAEAALTPLQSPLSGEELVITGLYGTRVHPITGETRTHNGIDFAAEEGTPVYAAGDGVVDEADFSATNGNYVVICHPDGRSTLYAHLHTASVAEGETVQAGAQIGEAGATGMATGPHLHFEVRQDGTCIDPGTALGWRIGDQNRTGAPELGDTE